MHIKNAPPVHVRVNVSSPAIFFKFKFKFLISAAQIVGYITSGPNKVKKRTLKERYCCYLTKEFILEALRFSHGGHQKSLVGIFAVALYIA